MTSRRLLQWFVAIVMIVGVASAGAGRSAPMPATESLSAGGITATVSDWSGAEAIIPVKPQATVAEAHRRSVPVKVEVTLAAAALSTAMVRQALRRPDDQQAPLAVRARSLPRRAPPLLSLV